MAAPREKTDTPGVYKRGDRYAVIYRDPDGKQRTRSARTKQEAKQLRAKLMTNVAEGDWTPASSITLAEYATAWIERHRGGRRGFREDTREDYRDALRRYIVPQLGRVRMDRLSPAHVDGFLRWMCDERAQGERRAAEARERKAQRLGVNALQVQRDADPAPVYLADATVRGIHAVLRSCLSSAVRDGVIRHNPAKGIELPERDEDRRIALGLDDDEQQVKVLTDDQLGWVLALVPDDHRALLALLAGTGLRISEALGLQWRHVGLGSSPEVRVRQRWRDGAYGKPKSKCSRRDVRLSDDVADALRTHRARSRFAGDDDPVFATRRRERKPGEPESIPLSYGNLYHRVLKPAAEEAGVPWIGFHTFRHTCASRWFAAGRNVKQVSKLLGHSSASFTLDTYVHLLPDDDGRPVPLPATPQGGSTGGSTRDVTACNVPQRATAVAA